MRTFLMTWNPAVTSIDHRVDEYAQWLRDRMLSSDWSTVSSKATRVDDRVFLTQQGSGARGILASGKVTSLPWSGYFIYKHDGSRHHSHFVDVEFDFMFDPESMDRLERSYLQEVLPDVHWDSQASGTQIKQPHATTLELLWAQRIGQAGKEATTAAVIRHAVEGIEHEHLILARSRNRVLRDEKLAETMRRHGGRLPCQVPRCGFDYFETYGKVGQSYAHVHHLTPLSETGKRVTRLDELIVVCANCHMMLHRWERPSVKTLIKRARRRAS